MVDRVTCGERAISYWPMYTPLADVVQLLSQLTCPVRMPAGLGSPYTLLQPLHRLIGLHLDLGSD
eukprot:4118023-Amphidinium_carterae.1